MPDRVRHGCRHVNSFNCDADGDLGVNEPMGDKPD